MGRVTYFLARIWESGAPKAEGGKKFSTHVSILKMLGFLWRNQVWVKNTEKKFFGPLTRLPSRPLAAGASICHLSPVTRAGGGGGWGGGGGL